MDEKVKLTIYAQYSDEDTQVPFDYAVEQLAIDYPNVELELITQAQDDGQTLQTYAATGDLPDIFQVGLAQINTFKKSGNILELDSYVDSTGYGEVLVPSASNLLWNEDGHAYAFPYAGNELVLLYYNKAIFEENGVKVPETYEELVTAIEVFNSNDIIPLSIFAKEGWITTALYDLVATRYASEGVVALDNGTAKGSDAAYATAAEKLQELVQLGLIADGATNTNYDQAASLFYEGKAAMFLNGQWEIQASTDALGDDVDWMWYPVFDGNDSQAKALAGGGAPGGYAVSPYSEHVDLAAEVAAYMSMKYCEAKYMFRANPLLAVQVPAGMEPETEWPPMMQKLAAELNNITSTTAFAWGLNNPGFKVAIEEQSQFLLTKGYTAEEFVKEIDKAVE
jgi:raffinose/stachyose/melibiose transport system substrate-binding protein